MTDNNDMELLVQQEGQIALALLNRPGALNSLSLEMIRMLAASLKAWSEDESVRAVFIEGAGDKAFCAGGDVKATYKVGMSYRKGEVDGKVISLFYGEEYVVNRALKNFEKPMIAFMDGITMGGGFGVAGPCKYRVATEKTLFAMPEVIIGFFPDVGSAYFLNKAPSEAGTWLALTGNKIKASDTLFCGFASHYIRSDKLPACKSAIAEALNSADDADKAIKDILDDFNEDVLGEGEIQDNIDVIKECFVHQNTEDILNALRKNDSDWASRQADIIESRSPISVKVSLAHLRMSKPMSFDEITAQDFVLAQHFMRGHDFYEGVRALLVDKDGQPQWEPSDLEQISKDMVQDYFRPAALSLDEIAT